MKEISSIAKMQELSRQLRGGGLTVGFVPTMGYLHDGHLELVRRARTECDVVVVSIFVNPTQFNNPEDFAKYPRDVAADRAVLEHVGVDVLFTPAASEVYPAGAATTVHVGALGDHLCGPLRPGHFDGVATIVTALFHMVTPDVAVFGEKDWQQLQIVRRMVRDLHLAVRIVGVPTIRESDGLAMSSRNARLGDAEREVAPALYRGLAAAVEAYRGGERRSAVLVDRVRSTIEGPAAAGVFRIEYLEVVDGEALAPVETANDGCVVAVAAFLGGVRLIDNVSLGFEERNPNMRKMLRGKIHRATVTGADLHYEGSVTIDETLMEGAGLIEHEAVCIWNVTNGERFETYALRGEPGSGVVCINGAAAHKASRGDLVIIAAFGWMPDEEALAWKPKVVFVDGQNRPVDLGRDYEEPGQARLKKVWG